VAAVVVRTGVAALLPCCTAAMASAEASSVVDVADELLDAHVLQMQLDGAWHFPAVFSGVEFDLPPLCLPPAENMVPAVHRALCEYGGRTSVHLPVTMGDVLPHVPRADGTRFSWDTMLPFASPADNARTALYFRDFVNPSGPRSVWELPNAHELATRVARESFALVGLQPPPATAQDPGTTQATEPRGD
jgi:hypothetical protein